jgi:hypothetical protein
MSYLTTRDGGRKQAKVWGVTRLQLLEWVGSGVRPNKKSHPHGWLDWFVSRFARLAYAASLRFRQA